MYIKLLTTYKNLKIYNIFILAFIAFISFNSSGFAQSDFKINPGCNLSLDPKGRELMDYINSNNNLQLLKDGTTTTEVISVYFNSDQRLVDFGSGQQRNLDATLINIFTGWTLCKSGEVSDVVTVPRPKETKIWAPFTYIPERIAANWNIRTTFDNQYLNLSSMDYYVNPYVQAFGGDPLGIPLAYGAGVGLTVGFGTPYSGPMETDFVSGGLHFAVFNVAVTSHVKEFVLKYSSGSNQQIESPNSWLGNWNNLFTPHLGIDFAMEIPVVRVSYFATIDTLDGINDPPIIVLNEVTGEPMKNNIVRGQHFGFEIRTPNLIFYNSTRAKFYFAKQFGEYHLGYVGREMKIDDFIFDFRMDATFPGPRDFQLLTELYIDSPWPGFANKSFGIGPSLRLGSTPSNNFGVISAFINARFKIGDFFDKNIY
ncbi:MAG TPA: hypothetical protein PKC58_06505 [Ignavibacteria bacterium]|nr:hypothetical protein [Ignavibacteria bacterium]